MNIENNTMIQKQMSKKDTLELNSLQKKKYLYVHECKSWRKPDDKIFCIIEDTPTNICTFIVQIKGYKNYAMIDEDGKVKVYTMGHFLDYVPNQNYLEKELLPIMYKIQNKKIDIPKIKYYEHEF